MNRSRSFSRRWRRGGLTLIEVLASTALLGVLLSASLISIGRLSRQARLAQDRVAALDEADALLRRWLVTQNGRIDSVEGLLPNRPGWTWRLSGRIEPELDALGAHVARLQVLGRDPQGDPRELAVIEFVSTSPLTGSLASGRSL